MISLKVEAAGMPGLVILCDVPTFGYRRDIRNVWPCRRMTFNNVLQIMGKPEWALKTLHGQPGLHNETVYAKGLNMKSWANI
jgi:L-lactate dehydrogenase (cytochrome)